MRSNKNHLIALLVPMLLIVIFSNIWMFVQNEIIIEKADILNTQIRENQKLIEGIKNQIRAYEQENNRLKNTVTTKKEKVQAINITYQSKPVVTDDHTNSDTYLLAQLIESESGNQSFKGKLAVGTVVMNRVESDQFPDTIKEVIFQKRQFSVVSNGSINNEPSDDSLKAAKEVLNGTRTLDSNVLYFYNPKFVSKTNWVRKRDIEKSIGDHLFAS